MIRQCCNVTFSLLPYSEPDQDLSPNNDSPPFDWGSGSAGPGGGGGGGAKHKHDKENRENKVGLTEKLLADKNNVIGERREFNSFEFLYIESLYISQDKGCNSVS